MYRMICQFREDAVGSVKVGLNVEGRKRAALLSVSVCLCLCVCLFVSLGLSHYHHQMISIQKIYGFHGMNCQNIEKS